MTELRDSFPQPMAFEQRDGRIWMLDSVWQEWARQQSSVGSWEADIADHFFSTGAQAAWDYQQAIIDRLMAEKARLVEKFVVYGDHTDDCAIENWSGCRPARKPDCSCGFDALLAALEEGE